MKWEIDFSNLRDPLQGLPVKELRCQKPNMSILTNFIEPRYYEIPALHAGLPEVAGAFQGVAIKGNTWHLLHGSATRPGLVGMLPRWPASGTVRNCFELPDIRETPQGGPSSQKGALIAYLVGHASSQMLVSKPKSCTTKHRVPQGAGANGLLYWVQFIRS